MATRPRPARGAFVDDYLLYLLARASAQASAQFHDTVKAAGLGVAEWRVLGSLWGRSATIGELAAMTLLQQPTLTKLVDRMAEAGLVERRRETGDRRRVSVAITARGRGLAARLIPRARAHEDRILGTYAADEAAALKRALKDLIARTL
jgi:DNA-binding MarR family transcriptional regulator